ncbi:MAG: hypothetical protein JWL86_3817 [Rhizobium sp.]|nr:hypothetical protein [Rhizobium sp.]
MYVDLQDPFIHEIDGARTVEATRALADDVAGIDDASLRQRKLLAGSYINPFFIPRKSAQNLNTVQALYAINQVRASAANSTSERIIVSAPMKTGSTFMSQALYIAFGLQPANLMMLTMRPFDYALYGAATRTQEIDELALLHSCLLPTGYVAHHHMLCSPLLIRQAELYQLKFVLLKRNIFDCFVSLDDFWLKYLRPVADTDEAYRRSLLPPGWAGLGDEDRMHHLLDASLPFYVNYHTSWALWESQTATPPLWISYEDDLLGDKAALAAKICAWIGRGEADVGKLTKEFGRERDGGQYHFNQGVAGRGKAIQGRNRQRILDAFAAYKNLSDWGEILG